ncbi:Uncharacterised protein [Mycobacteroides abscessus subsp. abscessus]|nr:Uncharacterised protein [Mycobacteroides abscessus subsp. abscessus]
MGPGTGSSKSGRWRSTPRSWRSCRRLCTDVRAASAFRRLHHSVSSRRPKSHHGTGIRPGSSGRAGSPGVSRGMVWRTSFRRVRINFLPRGFHRHRCRTHQAHQTGYRGRVAALPSPVDGGRPLDSVGPHHPWPRHLRYRPRRVTHRRVHDGHRSRRPKTHAGRVA